MSESIRINVPTVRNMQSARGNDVPNQFVMDNVELTIAGSVVEGRVFQSYTSIIAVQVYGGKTYLDADKWDYSVTTGRYRNQFLREGIAETREKIKDGRYVLADLNG